MIILIYMVLFYLLSVLFSGFCFLHYQNLMVNYCDSKYQTNNMDFRIYSGEALKTTCAATLIPIFNLIGVAMLIPDVWYFLRRAFFLKMYSFIKDEIDKDKIE